MCSVGGPFEIQIFDLGEENYQCGDCGKKFKWEGKKKPVCPECKSKKVSAL